MPTHHGEEKALAQILRNRRPGFYVDVGANDPYTTSNTHPFYLQGWRGVDVEPIPVLAERLRTAHPENDVWECVVGKEMGCVSLLIPEDERMFELATLDPGIAVRHAHSGF